MNSTNTVSCENCLVVISVCRGLLCGALMGGLESSFGGKGVVIGGWELVSHSNRCRTDRSWFGKNQTALDHFRHMKLVNLVFRSVVSTLRT